LQRTDNVYAMNCKGKLCVVCLYFFTYKQLYYLRFMTIEQRPDNDLLMKKEAEKSSEMLLSYHITT